MLIFGAAGGQAGVKNPDTFVFADYRTVQTIDPAASYDVAGSMRIWNLYETLIFTGRKGLYISSPQRGEVS